MEVNGYDLSRQWFDYCFENPEKVKPNHTALYFFCVEHCNRLGWKKKFGLPTTMAKEAIGIRSYNTYINTLNDLVEFGFIELIEKSKNQYSSNIIALSNFDKAHSKALDKALIKHVTKHRESTRQSIDSIIKQINNEQLTIEQIGRLRDIIEKKENEIMEIESTEKIIVKHEIYEFDEFWDDYDKKVGDKSKLIKKWAKISDKDKILIREYIPKYKMAQPDKRFRKHPQTFLNNKSWNDEIIESNENRDKKTERSDADIDRLKWLAKYAEEAFKE